MRIWKESEVVIVHQKYFTLNTKEIVSIIIPVYNRFDLAKRAIDSVISQTYRPLELIVVDDFSADIFSYEPDLDGKGDVNIKIVRTDSNVGPGTARETGRSLSSGQFLAYLDSDDVYKPEFIYEMVKYLKKNSEVDMVYCHAKYMSSEGLPTEESAKKTHMEYKNIFPFLLTHGRPWHTSTCLRRKSLSDKIGPWMSLWFWEDYEYDSRAGVINNKIGYVDQVLCYIDKEGELKVSKNPNTPKKARSYGLAVQQISHNVYNSHINKEDVSDRIIYHLMKSAARSIDSQFFAIAQKNIKELIQWVKMHKSTYLTVIFLYSLKDERFSKLKSRILRKISSRYRN